MVDLDATVVAAARRHTAVHGDLPDDATLSRLVREAGAVLGRADRAALAARVRATVLGAGPLQPLLEQSDVTDVLVNGPGSVWIDRGTGLERVDVDIGDAAAIRGLAVRLAAAGGQRLDDAQPVVDARLPDGTRLHAVLPPVAGGCTVISLRVLRPAAFTVDELVERGTLTPAVAGYLRLLVARRATMLVSGATGTGKTTLLSTLLSLAPPTERIVCIEEAGELCPDHPHVVRLLARRANVEQVGEVGLTDLVRHALRMRPDRIVLGECRGPEVREVLTAFNTGHDGGCATVHANAAVDVAARLEALGALAGMSREAVAAQGASALDVVLHLRRHEGRRYLAEIGVAGRGRTGLEIAAAVTVDPDGSVRYGQAWPDFERRWLREPW